MTLPTGQPREYRPQAGRALGWPLVLAAAAGIGGIVAVVRGQRPTSWLSLTLLLAGVTAIFLVIGLLRLRCRLRIHGPMIGLRGPTGGEKIVDARSVTDVWALETRHGRNLQLSGPFSRWGATMSVSVLGETAAADLMRTVVHVQPAVRLDDRARQLLGRNAAAPDSRERNRGLRAGGGYGI